MIYPIKYKDGKPDKRYTISKEYTGQWHKQKIKGLKQGQAYVLRFCGTYIDSSNTEENARIKAIRHNKERI